MTNSRADGASDPHPPPFAARYLARRMASRASAGPPGHRLRWLIVWWRGGPGAGGPPGGPGGRAWDWRSSQSPTKATRTERRSFSYV